MNGTTSELRPNIIKEIAYWRQQCLSAADQEGKALETINGNEIMAKFQCSAQEAVRGLCAEEQLYWGGS